MPDKILFKEKISIAPEIDRAGSKWFLSGRIAMAADNWRDRAALPIFTNMWN
jgi:hypothetical protein